MWTGTAPAVTGPFEIELVGEAGFGRYNMIGHGFGFDVAWENAEVDVGGGVFKRIADLTVGDVTTVLSSSKWEYNGSSYDVCDPRGVCAPEDDQSLVAFDGFWVKAFTNTTLRIPEVSSEPAPPAAENMGPEEWHVRLIVDSGSGEVFDRSNLLGRRAGAMDGYDPLDVEELNPFDGEFLQLVFPHPEWGGPKDDYSIDFREGRAGAGGSWDFEVKSDQPRNVTLRWAETAGVEGSILSRSVLVDVESGDEVTPTPGGTYWFGMSSTVHRFRWVINAVPQVDAGSDLGGVPEVPVWVTAIFSDEDLADVHTATIRWGDGVIEEALVDEHGGTVTGSHTYALEGSYEARVCVADQRGGTGCDDLVIVVTESGGFPFEDGFESGDTSAWTTTVP